MLHLVKQDDVMRAIFGKSKYVADLRLLFRLRHADGERREHRLVQGRARTSPRPKELFKKAGYDGRPVVDPAGDRPLLRQSGRPARRAMAARRPASMSSSPRCDWGAVRHPPRRQEAAGRGRLEHLLDHGDRRARSRTRSLRRPRRERRQGLVRLADERSAGEAARRLGAGRRRSRSARRSRASCRRTPGTTCRTSPRPVGCRRSAWRKNISGVIGMPGDRAVLERGEGVRRERRPRRGERGACRASHAPGRPWQPVKA